MKLFIYFLLMFVSTAYTKSVVRMEIEDRQVKDEGHVQSCGETPFTAFWSPKVLSPSGKVDITVNYTAPFSLEFGFVKASVYFLGDEEPFLQYNNKFVCDRQIKEYMACPIKKGEVISHSEIIPNLRILSSYPGDYTAIARVYNQDKQEMFCAKLTLSILEG